MLLSRRSLLAFTIALLQACSCGGSDSTPWSLAAAGAAGAAGGAVSGKAGSGGKAAAGSGPAGGGGGQATTWKKSPQKLYDCGYEVAEGHPKAFHWGPCAHTTDPHCEEAVFEPGWELDPKGRFARIANVWDLGTDVLLGLAQTGPMSAESTAFVTHADGTVEVAVRSVHPLAQPDYFCVASAAVTGPAGWALIYRGQPPGTDVPLAEWLASDLTNGEFRQIAKPTNGTGIQWLMVSTERLGAWWYPTIFSLDRSNPDPIIKFAGAGVQGPALYAAGPTYAPGGFLTEESRMRPDGSAPLRVYYSDGVSPSEQLVPDGNGDHGTARFAGDFLAWQVGSGTFKDGVGYEKAELWASPWSTSMSGLTPKKIDDLGTWLPIEKDQSGATGGFGRYAFAVRNGTTWDLAVWTLATGKRQTVPAPYPDNMFLKWYLLGITKDHVWFTLDNKDSLPRRLYRWNLVAP